MPPTKKNTRPAHALLFELDMDRWKNIGSALCAFLWLASTAPLAFGEAPNASLCGTELAATGLSPAALERVKLPDDAVSALGRLEVAASAHRDALLSFELAPNDEGTRRRYLPYAPYDTMLRAYGAFREAAEDVATLRGWPRAERLAAEREGIVAELARRLDETRARFEEEWRVSGRRFLDGPLGRAADARAFAPPPIRLRFSDRQVAEFFDRCRGGDAAAAQSCAGHFAWARYARVALRRLELVNGAATLDEIKLRTKELKRYSPQSRYAGYYAIEIDHQFRLLFHWDFARGTAVDVFIEDYHAE